MAEKDDWDVVPMWKADCSPSALYADVAGSAVSLSECRAWLKWALETIPSLHPSAVFISFLDAYGTPEVATKAESGLSSLLVWAKKAGNHVVLMLDSPLLSSLPLPVDCLQQSGATLRTCTGRWGGGPFDSSQALRALARLHHVGVIDPVGWFCYKGLCPLVIGHTIAFADLGHVTRTYATALTPPFRAAFRAALHAR
jgi:hypothetical protein